jgi:hypothetical protein
LTLPNDVVLRTKAGKITAKMLLSSYPQKDAEENFAWKRQAQCRFFTIPRSQPLF